MLNMGEKGYEQDSVILRDLLIWKELWAVDFKTAYYMDSAHGAEQYIFQRF